MTEDVPKDAGDNGEMKRLVRLATAVYVLQALGLVLPVCLVVAVIIDYVKLPDTAGTWIESHFRWQIRTFWVAVVLMVLGIASFLFVVGYFILLGTCVWVIYRVVKGWLYLNDRRELARKS